jgi:hypothetical protein
VMTGDAFLRRSRAPYHVRSGTRRGHIR